MKPPPLIIVTCYLDTEERLQMLKQVLARIDTHTGNYELLIIDDGSPRQDLLAELHETGFRIICKPENEGKAKAVNIGLAQARTYGQDAVLIDGDVHLAEDGWLETFESSEGDVVGALLLYPNGLVQHAGVYFSIISRQFDYIYRFAPGSTPNVGASRMCPVSGSLMYIRHAVLDEIGLMDEGFPMGYEDVDFCIRAFQHGFECQYQPQVRALHFEQFFRGTAQAKKSDKILEWEDWSLRYLHRKYQRVGFADWVPTLMWDEDLA